MKSKVPLFFLWNCNGHFPLEEVEEVTSWMTEVIIRVGIKNSTVEREVFFLDLSLRVGQLLQPHPLPLSETLFHQTSSRSRSCQLLNTHLLQAVPRNQIHSRVECNQARPKPDVWHLCNYTPTCLQASLEKLFLRVRDSELIIAIFVCMWMLWTCQKVRWHKNTVNAAARAGF